MRKLFCYAIAVVVASFAAVAHADTLDFDDVDTFGDFLTPLPDGYNGWNWSNAAGGGNWYVDTLASINDGWGGTLDTISGPNIAYNAFGDDDLWVDLGGDYFLESAYLTNWPNTGDFGSPAVRVQGYDDGGLVYDTTFETINDEWIMADFGGVVVDEIHFLRTTPDVSWWLMDDLSLTAVPTPGALALLGVGALVGARRRRS